MKNAKGNSKIKLTDIEARNWYVDIVRKVKDNIDQYSLENKVVIAFDRRNAVKDKARDLMEDEKKRRFLDEKYSNPIFF